MRSFACLCSLLTFRAEPCSDYWGVLQFVTTVGGVVLAFFIIKNFLGKGGSDTNQPSARRDAGTLHAMPDARYLQPFNHKPFEHDCVEMIAAWIHTYQAGSVFLHAVLQAVLASASIWFELHIILGMADCLQTASIALCRLCLHCVFDGPSKSQQEARVCSMDCRSA